jgi:uncharacterized membrane protein YtjA (UPF0391 family)
VISPRNAYLARSEPIKLQRDRANGTEPHHTFANRNFIRWKYTLKSITSWSHRVGTSVEITQQSSCAPTGAGLHNNKEIHMLRLVLIFAVIALIAGAMGFTGVAGASAGIAKIIFTIFLILVVLALLGVIFGISVF